MASEDDVRRIFEAQRQQQREQRAAMQEVLSELRQAVLQSGVEPGLLREFELGAIDLALLDVLERNTEARLRNLTDPGAS